jgi:factor associated with neutral sphingomyelinase activation
MSFKGCGGLQPPSFEVSGAPQAEGGWLQRVTAAWQAGRLSNLDYLLFLNLAAGRSFCDLAQWPVVPWVLADYTSDALDQSDSRSAEIPCAIKHAHACGWESWR